MESFRHKNVPNFGRSAVTFVHCAKTAAVIDTISFAYDSPMSLPGRVKIRLTSVNPFLPNFAQMWSIPVDWVSETFDGKLRSHG